MMKKLLQLSLIVCFSLLGLQQTSGQTTIYSQGFETNLDGYSHTPSQIPSDDAGDQYFHRAEPSDASIYEGSVGPYTNVSGSWLFVGSNPNSFNSSSPGILNFDPINVSGYTNLELSADFGAVPNDWDNSDELKVEYNFDGGPWSTLYSFGHNNGFNKPITLIGNAIGGINTTNGTTLTYALTSIVSDNFSGSGTILNLRIVCDSNANYEAFGVDEIILKGTSLTPTPTLTTSPTTITALNYIEGSGPSVAQSFEVTGANLDGSNVVVSLPLGSDFEIAETAGGSYSSVIFLTAYDGTATDIFVRLKSGLLVGNFSDEVSVSGGGASIIDVVVSGEVTPQPPTNDECANAIALVVNDPAVSGTLEASTFATPFDKNDVWYSITPTYDETYTISLSNFSGDADLFLFDQSSACPTTTTTIASAATLNNPEVISESLVSGTTYYIRVLAFNEAAESTFDIEVTAPPQRDFDTEVFEPITPLSQVPASTQIAADVTTPANAFPAFAFVVEDQGTLDNLPTHITRMRLVPGPNNTADWTDHIQGVRIADQSLTELFPTVSISDTEIILDFSPSITIADGASLGFGVGIYLNTNAIVDNSILQFQIDGASNGFTADNTGSGFADPFLLGDIEGNDHTIDVEATQLSFSNSFPLNVDVNSNFSLTVNAIDVNGNLDLDSTESVTLSKASGSGNLSGTLVQNLSNGTFDFSDLQFDEEDTHTISTSSILTNVTSGNINVVEAPSLIITEVADPGDNFGGRFVEIYNNGDSPIDLGAQQIHVARQANGSGFSSVALMGTLKPDHLLVIGNSSNINALYGFNADVDFGDITGNGDDGYFIYYNGDESTGTLLDAYGVVGQDGTGQDWEYEDSRAIRNNPKTVSPTATWTSSQWTITSADVANMTPGELENEYRYKNGWLTSGDPSGVSTSTDDIKIIEGTAVITSATTALNTEVKAGAVLDLDADLTSDILFKSDDSGSGQLADATGITITGNVTVERYIPARRAFRFLSSAVSGQSIAGAWQQNTHITGTGGATNGFDPSGSDNPSMFTFDASAQGWLPVSTTSTVLEAGTAYRIMVRGDRTIDLLDANANDETPKVTTLVATGNLATGDLTTGTDLPQLSQDASTTSPTEETKFSFVGNPYQAVVDASLLTYNGGVRSDFIVFWDPNLGDRGAFVQVELSTGSIILPTPAPTPSSTAASKFIMPGQAFFVGNASSVTTPSITFTEAAKATSQTQTSVFSTTSLAYLNLRLYTQSAWSNNQPEQDALGIRWSSDYTTDVSIEDIVKLGNPDENIAVNNSNILLGIDKRNLPTSEEIIPLFINNYEEEDYVIFNQHENLPEGANLYLEDHYLETSTLLENDEVYEFNVDATIPASTANNRFTIRYEVGTLSQTDFTENSFSMYPNPVQDELNIQWNSIQNEDTQFTIFNIVGKKIAEFIQNASSEVNSIPVYNLEAGVYLLKIQNQEINATKKFIKR